MLEPHPEAISASEEKTVPTHPEVQLGFRRKTRANTHASGRAPPEAGPDRLLTVYGSGQGRSRPTTHRLWVGTLRSGPDQPRLLQAPHDVFEVLVKRMPAAPERFTHVGFSLASQDSEPIQATPHIGPANSPNGSAPCNSSRDQAERDQRTAIRRRRTNSFLLLPCPLTSHVDANSGHAAIADNHQAIAPTVPKDTSPLLVQTTAIATGGRTASRRPRTP